MKASFKKQRDQPSEFQGPVVLKRKLFWVEREALVSNQTFSYKKSSEPDFKNHIDLLSAEIDYGQVDKSKILLEIRSVGREPPLTLRLLFSNQEEFLALLNVIKEAQGKKDSYDMSNVIRYIDQSQGILNHIQSKINDEKYLQQSAESIRTLQKILAVQEWAPVDSEITQGIPISQISFNDWNNVFKCEYVFNHPFELVFERINRIQETKEQLKFYEQGTLLKQLTEEVRLIYMKTKKMSLLTSRDFIILKTNHTTPTGQSLIVFQSIEEEGVVIEQKETIRAHINISGWLLERVPEGVKAVYVMSVEMGGSIPMDFKMFLLKQRFLSMESLRLLFEGQAEELKQQ